MHANWGIVLTVKNSINNISKTAVIDIGSNSVRFALYPCEFLAKKEVVSTGLAKGFNNGILDQNSIDRTTDAISTFYKKAKNDGVGNVMAFATAALRNATNKNDFFDSLKKRCDLKIEIISGEEEGFFGAYGALEGADGGVIDVGGASTELTVFRDGKAVFSKSVNVGAVTLTEKFGNDKSGAKEYLSRVLSDFSGNTCDNLFAIGGTATTLAAIKLKLFPYDPFKVHGLKVDFLELETLTNELYSKGLEERKNIIGLAPQRAEIIHSGVLILTEALKLLKMDSLIVSEKDNMDAYYVLKGKING